MVHIECVVQTKWTFSTKLPTGLHIIESKPFLSCIFLIQYHNFLKIFSDTQNIFMFFHIVVKETQMDDCEKALTPMCISIT